MPRHIGLPAVALLLIAAALAACSAGGREDVHESRDARAASPVRRAVPAAADAVALPIPAPTPAGAAADGAAHPRATGPVAFQYGTAATDGSPSDSLLGPIGANHPIEWSGREDGFARYHATAVAEGAADALRRRSGVRAEMSVVQRYRSGPLPADGTTAAFSAAREMPLEHLGAAPLRSYAGAHGPWSVGGGFALDPAHEQPTGMWSDDSVVLIAHDPSGDGAALYAYNLVEDGERAPEAEWELDGRNRAPSGIAGAGEVVWVADGEWYRLFAYDPESGAPLPGRDIWLGGLTGDARGIWAGGTLMYVLDGVSSELHVYDLATGAPLGRHGLDPANGDPQGLWCDGAVCWVSDPGATRLFAYRLPSDPAAGGPLERVRGEEFDALAAAGNGSPRGIGSDGALLYVADALDGTVYGYSLPAAIDARLASLSLSDVDIGYFSPLRTEYRGDALARDVVTTVRAEARPGAAVEIEPPDSDGHAANGHQVALGDGIAITVTVTSPDGSRTRTYRVLAGGSCLRGDVTRGLSLVVHAGGTIPGLDACARERNVTALYTLREGRWVAWAAGAPNVVNGRFGALWGQLTPAGPAAIPAGTPLLAASGGPPSTAPFSGTAATPPGPWRECLRGDVARALHHGDRFSLVLFEGGSVEALGACARWHGVAELYAIGGGGWVSYLVDGPEPDNRPFAELFPGGLPRGTPLLVRTTPPPSIAPDDS